MTTALRALVQGEGGGGQCRADIYQIGRDPRDTLFMSRIRTKKRPENISLVVRATVVKLKHRGDKKPLRGKILSAKKKHFCK